MMTMKEYNPCVSLSWCWYFFSRSFKFQLAKNCVYVFAVLQCSLFTIIPFAYFDCISCCLFSVKHRHWSMCIMRYVYECEMCIYGTYIDCTFIHFIWFRSFVCSFLFSFPFARRAPMIRYKIQQSVNQNLTTFFFSLVIVISHNIITAFHYVFFWAHASKPFETNVYCTFCHLAINKTIEILTESKRSKCSLWWVQMQSIFDA